MYSTIKSIFEEKIGNKNITINILPNGDMSIKCDSNIYNFNGLNNKEALRSVQVYEGLSDQDVTHILKSLSSGPRKQGVNLVSLIKTERNGFIKK